MLYPPQIVDFSFTCPNGTCASRDWLITKRNEETVKIRCKTCAKEYELKFKGKQKKEKITDSFDFIYSTKVNCPQCRQVIAVAGVSAVPEKTIKCKKCGLAFDIEVGKSELKLIDSFKELEVKTKSSANPEGGKTMSKEKDKEEKVIESTEEVEEKVEVKEEEKVVETPEEKVEEKEEKVEEAEVESTEEKPAEEVEEKVEETPEEEVEVEEEKVEEKKVEEATEEKAEEETVTEAAESSEVTVDFTKTYRSRIKKLIDVIRKTRTKLSEVTSTRDSKIKFYQDNAKKLLERREELGECGKNLTDEQIMDDKDFKIAKYEKELEIKREEDLQESVDEAKEKDVATAVVGDITKKLSVLDKTAAEITKRAFAHANKEQE